MSQPRHWTTVNSTSIYTGNDTEGPITASRRPLLQPVNPSIPIPPSYEVDVGATKVKFPYRNVFESQKVVMESTLSALSSGQHALIQSPTGTGKSLALLSATLAYMEKDMSITRIYYTSRTHSQLKQIVSELRRLPYFPKMSTIASRKKLCIYPPVRGSVDMDAACKDTEKHGGCPYDRVAGEIAHFSISGDQPKFDLEDLLVYGSSEQLCPYYMAKKMAAAAELVVCPYNYLLSPGRNLPVSKGCVVVFDEGHNIDSTCRNLMSFSSTAAELDNVANDASEVPQDSRYIHLFRFMNAVARGFSQFILQKRDEYAQSDGETSYLYQESYQRLIESLGFSVHEFNVNATKLVEWTSKYEMDPASYDDYATTPLLAFADKVAPISKFLTKDNVDDFRVAYLPGERPELDRISVLCMRPGILFNMVSGNTKSVILASGTLEPFNALASELECSFPIRTIAPHVVDPSQVFTISINSCNHVQLTSLYRQMQEKGFETMNAVSIVLEKLIPKIPGGILLFLPSYKIKANLIQTMQKNGSWTRISKHKTIIEEEPSKEVNELMNEMQRAGWNSLLLGVCRGKMSEGMDFSDNRARCVIVFGVPYPAFGVPEVDLKRKFNDMKCKTIANYLTGSKWYELQAYRALSQAVGRCIRHSSDYGTIVLMDYRMDLNLDQFPSWIVKNIRLGVNLEEATRRIGAFFKEMRKRFSRIQTMSQSHSAKPIPETHPETAKSEMKVTEEPHVEEKEEPETVLKQETMQLFCMNCRRPVLSFLGADAFSFEKCRSSGFMKVTMTVEKELDVMLIAEDNVMAMFASVDKGEWCDTDSCYYKLLTCTCGAVLGAFVASSGVKSQFRSGIYVIYVRCLSLEFLGQFMSFDSMLQMVSSAEN